MSALYRWLLGCYPPVFRARFGDELVDAFDVGIRASRTRGLMPALAFAVTRLADVVTSGMAERWAERSTAQRAGRAPGFGPALPPVCCRTCGSAGALASPVCRRSGHPGPLSDH